MGLGTAAGDAQAVRSKRAGEGHSVGHDLVLEMVELLCLGQAEGDGHCGELVDVGTALQAGEDSPVYLLRQAGVGGEDAGPSRATERLMGGEGDDVGVPQWGGEGAGDDHAGHVGDVGQEVGTYPVGDLAELGPVRDARVGGITGDDQFGPVFQRQFLDFVVVQ